MPVNRGTLGDHLHGRCGALWRLCGASLVDSRLQPETERWLGDEAKVHASTKFQAMLAKDKEKGRDWSEDLPSRCTGTQSKAGSDTHLAEGPLGSRTGASGRFVVKHPAETEATWLQLTKTLTGVTPGFERKDPYRVTGD